MHFLGSTKARCKASLYAAEWRWRWWCGRRWRRGLHEWASCETSATAHSERQLAFSVWNEYRHEHINRKRTLSAPKVCVIRIVKFYWNTGSQVWSSTPPQMEPHKSFIHNVWKMSIVHQCNSLILFPFFFVNTQFAQLPCFMIKKTAIRFLQRWSSIQLESKYSKHLWIDVAAIHLQESSSTRKTPRTKIVLDYELKNMFRLCSPNIWRRQNTPTWNTDMENKQIGIQHRVKDVRSDFYSGSLFGFFVQKVPKEIQWSDENWYGKAEMLQF